MIHHHPHSTKHWTQQVSRDFLYPLVATSSLLGFQASPFVPFVSLCMYTCTCVSFRILNCIVNPSNLPLPLRLQTFPQRSLKHSSLICLSPINIIALSDSFHMCLCAFRKRTKSCPRAAHRFISRFSKSNQPTLHNKAGNILLMQHSSLHSIHL